MGRRVRECGGMRQGKRVLNNRLIGGVTEHHHFVVRVVTAD